MQFAVTIKLQLPVWIPSFLIPENEEKI
jgi:hypothetical protein